MNCQEVTELMQRQLDDDLRDSEMEILMNHTRHCPDCAAMFERLTRLSAELSSLPKVTPSYSLVDAIMPELIRIDNEAKQSAAAAKPAEAEQQPIARRAQRTRRWPSWKSITGVVAAGVVAGIFLITNPPQSGVSNNDAGSAIGNSAAMKQRASELNDDVTPLSASTDAGGDASDMPAANERFVEGQGEASNQGVTEFSIAEAQDSDATAGRNNSKSADGAQSGESPEVGTMENAPGMGIAAHGLITSPDGQYVASVDQFSVVILSAADGKELFKSDRKNGQHGNLMWSPESNELMYEVSLEHGAAQKYVIDISTLKESKAD